MRRINRMETYPKNIKTFLFERVSSVLGIPIEEIKMKCRKKELVMARSIIMYLASKRYGYTSSEIEKWFPHVKGSTIRSNILKIESWRNYSDVSFIIAKVGTIKEFTFGDIGMSDYVNALGIVRRVEKVGDRVFHLQRRLSETNDDKYRKLLFNEYRKKWKSKAVTTS